MKKLAQKIGQDRVIWRYDPVILTSITDEDFHHRNFDFLARELAGSVRGLSSVFTMNIPRQRSALNYKSWNLVTLIPNCLAALQKARKPPVWKYKAARKKKTFLLLELKAAHV